MVIGEGDRHGALLAGELAQHLALQPWGQVVGGQYFGVDLEQQSASLLTRNSWLIRSQPLPSPPSVCLDKVRDRSHGLAGERGHWDVSDCLNSVVSAYLSTPNKRIGDRSVQDR